MQLVVGIDDMDTAIGPAGDGALLEAGFIRSEEGATPARQKFLR